MVHAKVALYIRNGQSYFKPVINKNKVKAQWGLVDLHDKRFVVGGRCNFIGDATPASTPINCN